MTLRGTCQLSRGDKLNAGQVVLSGDALIHYSLVFRSYSKDEYAATAIHKWYNYSDEGAKILTKLQFSQFSKEIMNSSNSSEVEMFGNLKQN